MSIQSGAGHGIVPPVFLWIWGLRSVGTAIIIGALAVPAVALIDEDFIAESFAAGGAFAGAKPASL